MDGFLVQFVVGLKTTVLLALASGALGMTLVGCRSRAVVGLACHAARGRLQHNGHPQRT
ncbi:MAG: hypothetical protein J0I23_10580 [Rhizobiales bacterium]|nr:hypothetical protein [Hyphomicrobiales bacterium]